MIPIPSGAQVWLATGNTDMRKGFDGLALLVQETLRRNPHNGHLFVFRGRRGSLIKILWHDGQGMCLYAKRLERGRFIWPSTAPCEGVDRTVTITPAQLGICCETPAVDIRPEFDVRRTGAERHRSISKVSQRADARDQRSRPDRIHRSHPRHRYPGVPRQRPKSKPPPPQTEVDSQ
jgi:transposase